MNPVASIALVALTLATAYGVLHVLGARFHWTAETKRKAIHVSLGLVCLTFPWLFDESWPVGLLGVLSVVVLAILRVVPRFRQGVASDLHGIDRFSLGELFFPAVVAWCFIYSDGNLVLYLVPVAVLTLADAGGALMGVRFGTRKFTTLGSGKSVEGSLSFFLVALVCVGLPLYLTTDLPITNLLVIACILAGLATLVEGFASHGSDNLLLPIACLLILEVFLKLPVDALLIRLGVLAAIVPLLCLGGRFTSLDGGGILGACLFGYACYALGGGAFLVAALVYYALYLVTTFLVRRKRELHHGVHIVVIFSLVCLVWLSLNRAGLLAPITAFRCFLLALGAQVTFMHCGASLYLGRPRPGYLLALAKGAPFLLAAAVLAALPPALRPLSDLLTLLVSAATFSALVLGLFLTSVLFVRWRGPATVQSPTHQLKSALLALPFSALGLLI